MSWFRRLLGRDDPPTLVQQMRRLWRLPPNGTLPCSARVVPPKPKPQSLDAWKQKYGSPAAERKVS